VDVSFAKLDFLALISLRNIFRYNVDTDSYSTKTVLSTISMPPPASIVPLNHLNSKPARNATSPSSSPSDKDCSTSVSVDYTTHTSMTACSIDTIRVTTLLKTGLVKDKDNFFTLVSSRIDCEMSRNVSGACLSFHSSPRPYQTSCSCVKGHTTYRPTSDSKYCDDCDTINHESILLYPSCGLATMTETETWFSRVSACTATSVSSVAANTITMTKTTTIFLSKITYTESFSAHDQPLASSATTVDGDSSTRFYSLTSPFVNETGQSFQATHQFIHDGSCMKTNLSQARSTRENSLCRGKSENRPSRSTSTATVFYTASSPIIIVTATSSDSPMAVAQSISESMLASSPTTVVTALQFAKTRISRCPCHNGYACATCLEGCFCPPLYTPGSLGNCGFGWACADCENGWFCPFPSSSISIRETIVSKA
jgi:hypothetical protein